MHRWILLVALCWLGLALGCGGKGAVAAGEKKPAETAKKEEPKKDAKK